MGEVWFHKAMQVHPWRVNDPEDANLFYIPMYPVLSRKVQDEEPQGRCHGLTHTERMDAAVGYLTGKSSYFHRLGGSDHLLICAWWRCKSTFDHAHKQLLRRVILGINERLMEWTEWGCGIDKLVTVPYTASSALTTTGVIGGVALEQRDITFFFAGSSRSRPERTNLQVSTCGDFLLFLYASN